MFLSIMVKEFCADISRRNSTYIHTAEYKVICNFGTKHNFAGNKNMNKYFENLLEVWPMQ